MPASNLARKLLFLIFSVLFKSGRDANGSRFDGLIGIRSAVPQKRMGYRPVSRSAFPETRAGHAGKPKTRAHTCGRRRTALRPSEGAC